MTNNKIYTTPELNSYGEFAQLTQQSGTGTFDFIGSIDSNGNATTDSTTPGADPRTSEVNIGGVDLGVFSL